jgi:DNA processing protein
MPSCCAASVLAALPDLAGCGGSPYRPAPEARIADEIAAVWKAGARYMFHDSPDYPPLLAQIEGAPPILIARGEAGIAARPAVAIVGARNVSAGAVKLARTFALQLVESGLAVVSGLARRIDGAAHRGALAAGA